MGVNNPFGLIQFGTKRHKNGSFSNYCGGACSQDMTADDFSTAVTKDLAKAFGITGGNGLSVCPVERLVNRIF